MKQYLELMQKVLDEGTPKNDRTGTGTLSIFGHQMRFNLQEGFPLVTTKRCHLRSIIHELLWFLQGDTNIAYLKENKVSIWDEWADEEGELGPVYGRQWRSWPSPDGGTIDQIAWLLDEIKRNPHSRRLVVSAWNPADLAKMALAPCHCLSSQAVRLEGLKRSGSGLFKRSIQFLHGGKRFTDPGPEFAGDLVQGIQHVFLFGRLRLLLSENVPGAAI